MSELDFENRADSSYDGYESVYQEILETAFALLNIQTNYEVDVTLLGDGEIQQINRDYRGVDHPTDVISFAFNDDPSEEGKILDPEIPHMLGEIFIDVEQAERQAKDIGNSVHRELSFLFCHGLLHLLGYDHLKESDEKIMFPLQDKILKAVEEKEK